MSQLNVDTIGSQTGTTISIASGHTLDAGGLRLVNKTTVSAQNYATVDNVFSSTYSMYKIKVNLVASATDQLRIRFRTGGASGSDHSTSSLYKYNYNYVPIGSSTGQTHLGSTPNDYWQLASAFSCNTGFGMEIYNPYAAKNTLGTWEVMGSQSSTDYFYFGAGVVEDTTSLTGFGFYLNTSDRTLTGEILTYGYSEV